MTLGTTVSALLLSVGANLITPVFEAAKRKIEDPIQQALVRSKLNVLSASAFMKMESYLRNEVRGSDAEARISIIISEAKDLVPKLVKNNRAVIESNYDADRLVSHYIAKNGYPQAIQSDGTTTAFLHFVTVTASMALEIPNLITDWEKVSWSISFAKIDELAVSLAQQTERVLKVSEDVATLSEGKIPIDKAMAGLKNALMQAKARNQLEMSGLSPAQAASAQLKSIFVAPELQSSVGDDRPKASRSLSSANEVISELTRSNSVFRITGSAGSGKTTLLRWIEQWHWTASLRIAVRCELRTISKAGHLPSLLDLFASCIPAGLRGTLTNEDFSRWLNSGRCMVIFDGFDEVSQARRDDVLEWIKGCIAGSNTANTFLISSRALTTSHFSDDSWKIDGWKLDEAWNVSGFDAARVEQYIKNWQEHMLLPHEREALTESDHPSTLASTFMEAETIRELTSNPLLLSTLMIIHRFQGKKLPKNRSDLYKVYIDGMLGPWYEKKTNSKDDFYLESDQMRRLLKLLAIEMQESEFPSLPEAKAGRLISKNKGDIPFTGPKILEHMLERTGLLIGPGDYQFAHKSIGEFLVAEAIVSENFRNKSGDRIDRLHLLNHATEDSWRVALFLWVGLVPSLNDLKSFCHSLIELGYLQIAIGVVEERYDDLNLDHKDDLRGMLLSICSYPAIKVNTFPNSSSTGMYVGASQLPIGYSGMFEIHSIGCLTISGIDHFLHECISRAYRSGTLAPEAFAGHSGDNSFYFELWLTWVRDGVDLSTLLDSRPTCLSKRQALNAIIRSRGLTFSISPSDEAVRDLLCVPYIIDEIIEHFSRRRYYLKDDALAFPHIDAIDHYLCQNPIDQWQDDWIVTGDRDDTTPDLWQDNDNWARVDSSFQSREVKILRAYRSRVLNLMIASDNCENASPLESLWSEESEMSLCNFISFDISSRGSTDEAEER